jgi:hypothetical protein
MHGKKNNHGTRTVITPNKRPSKNPAFNQLTDINPQKIKA